MDQRTAVCKQIAFYGSTPAYRPVLELHGWGGLQTELNSLSKQGQWDTMGQLIDDKILEAFAIVGTPDEIIPRLKARYGDAVDRVTLNFGFGAKASSRELIAALHG
jgi:alkanesulfonate monooxygenase SsuD/methylene tetrahydromethanopterin reductase-like flavin-dependent oxidoreductase (luciferase family)